jgi:hypothetical protein
MTFRQLTEEHYLPWAKENKKRHAGDEHLYRNWLKPRFADKELRQIAPLDLERLKKEMRESGKAEATIRHALCLVRQAFNEVVVWRLWTGKNPCKGVAFPTPNNARQRFLSQDEADQQGRNHGSGQGDLGIGGYWHQRNAGDARDFPAGLMQKSGAPLQCDKPSCPCHKTEAHAWASTPALKKVWRSYL